MQLHHSPQTVTAPTLNSGHVGGQKQQIFTSWRRLSLSYKYRGFLKSEEKFRPKFTSVCEPHRARRSRATPFNTTVLSDKNNRLHWTHTWLWKPQTHLFPLYCFKQHSEVQLTQISMRQNFKQTKKNSITRRGKY